MKANIQVSLGELKFSPVDLHSLHILSPYYEINVSRLLALNEGEVLVDIGAHIGRYTIQAGKMVGKEGLVVAVEPECNNFAVLLRNIQQNKLDNVVPLSFAAWNKQRKLKLYISEKSGWYKLEGTEGKFIEVEGKKVDDVIKMLELQRVDWIKVDVEGAEFEVIEGTSNTIKKFYPKMIIEITNKKTIQLMEDLGYSCIQIPPLISNNYYCKKKSQKKKK